MADVDMADAPSRVDVDSKGKKVVRSGTAEGGSSEKKRFEVKKVQSAKGFGDLVS